MASMKPREKRTLAVGGVILLIMIMLWYFVLWENSLVNRWGNLRNRIEARENVRRRMLKIRKETLALQSRIGRVLVRMADQEKGLALKGFLEKMVGEKAPSASLNRMKTDTNTVHDLYRETIVWVKLNRVNLKELVDFLYSVETEGGALRVQELSIDIDKKKPDLLDVEFTVISAAPLDQTDKEGKEIK